MRRYETSVARLGPYCTYICEEVAYPFASVSARIGRHMDSLATLMKLRTFRDRIQGAVRHAPINDLIKTQVIRRIFVDVLRKFFELPEGRVDVQGFLFRLAKYLWEIFRDEPSQQQVSVCHCQRTAFSIFYRESCLRPARNDILLTGSRSDLVLLLHFLAQRGSDRCGT